LSTVALTGVSTSGAGRNRAVITTSSSVSADADMQNGDDNSNPSQTAGHDDGRKVGTFFLRRH
jgi:hypothetical protein